VDSWLAGGESRHRSPAPLAPWAGRDGEGGLGRKGKEGPAHRSLPPLAPWAGTGREGRLGSKGGQGPAKGGNLCPPRKWVSFFTRRPPPLLLQRFQKMPVKPLSPPRLTALVSPIRTPRTLTACDAVALELVREHPLLTEIGSQQRPRQPVFSGSRPTRSLAAPMATSSGPCPPGCAEDFGEAFDAMHSRCLSGSYWAVGSSADRPIG
jgi:hypothetical protein